MTSLLTHLECTRCGRHFDADVLQTLCPDDGGVLYARYELERGRRELDRAAVAARTPGMWQIPELMPVRDPANIVMLGEGTFHQVHGGVATNATVPDKHLEYHEEYVRLRGRNFEFPRVPTVHLGQASLPAMRVIEQSARLAPLGHPPRDRLPAGFDGAWYLRAHPDVAAAGLDAGEHFLSRGQFEARAWRPAT